MLKWLNNQLNQITMYKLVLYFLLILIGVALFFSAIGILPYNPLALIFSTLFITLICWLANIVCAKIFKATTNVESIYITALILVLIISPPKELIDTFYFSLAGWASIWAMASKYVFTIGRKHLFNPAAFAIAATALVLNQSASWWIGTAVMLPFVLLGGLLVAKKIRRLDLMISFFVVALAMILGAGFLRGANMATFIVKTFTNTPMLFFAFVMLTEPLTTPPTRKLIMLYGAITGFLFAPWVHVGPLYSTPELALITGNIFSYLVSPKQKLILFLKERVTVAHNTLDFIFHPDQPLKFQPGQYMEWTLGHKKTDSRGNRRYFTIASSPTETELRLGVKFYEPGSSFKHAMTTMGKHDSMVAAQLAGDFTLPKDKSKKLVFVAGGIGVTPFRSMIKYLIDTKEHRDIVIFYSNKDIKDIAYADVFHTAEKELGIKTVYTLTDTKAIPTNWSGKTGYFSKDMIVEEVPDYKHRTFYISGPHTMVTNFEDTLKQLNIPKHNIKTDFFPGFA